MSDHSRREFVFLVSVAVQLTLSATMLLGNSASNTFITETNVKLKGQKKKKQKQQRDPNFLAHSILESHIKFLLENKSLWFLCLVYLIL